MSKDPIGFAGGTTNLYQYAGNNPLTNTDPSGTGPISAAACVAVARRAGVADQLQLDTSKQQALDLINQRIQALSSSSGSCGKDNSAAIAALQAQAISVNRNWLAATLANGVQVSGEIALCNLLIAAPGP